MVPKCIKKKTSSVAVMKNGCSNLFVMVVICILMWSLIHFCWSLAAGLSIGPVNWNSYHTSEASSGVRNDHLGHVNAAHTNPTPSVPVHQDATVPFVDLEASTSVALEKDDLEPSTSVALEKDSSQQKMASVGEHQQPIVSAQGAEGVVNIAPLVPPQELHQTSDCDKSIPSLKFETGDETGWTHDKMMSEFLSNVPIFENPFFFFHMGDFELMALKGGVTSIEGLRSSSCLLDGLRQALDVHPSSADGSVAVHSCPNGLKTYYPDLFCHHGRQPWTIFGEGAWWACKSLGSVE
jgi:hypothetical protein